MANHLYLKHNYLNKDIAYLRNNIIREYDMVNAGINILRHNNIFSQEEYDQLNSMDKLEKNILVGKFLKNNPDISDALMNEFINIRKELFDRNGITDDDVLSIKKDAIFVINKKIHDLELNEFYQFQEKNKYIGYMNIDNKEFYYDMTKRRLDIKGFSKHIKEFHKDYLFKELEELMYLDLSDEKNMVFEKLIQFKYNFVTKELPKEYYYDIQQGKYLFETIGQMFHLEDIDDDLKKICFINNNLNFILKIIKTIL
jgi:hypothetical protein